MQLRESQRDSFFNEKDTEECHHSDNDVHRKQYNMLFVLGNANFPCCTGVLLQVWILE